MPNIMDDIAMNQRRNRTFFSSPRGNAVWATRSTRNKNCTKIAEQPRSGFMHMVERDIENSCFPSVEIIKPRAVHIPRPNPYCRVCYVANVIVDHTDISLSGEKDAERLLQKHLTTALENAVCHNHVSCVLGRTSMLQCS